LTYRGIYIIALILGLTEGEALGQYFINPSFEGTPGISTVPPAWEPFDPSATPDTEPLPCDHFPASDGDTYLTLVTRGTGSGSGGTGENVVTSLLLPIEQGKYYRLSVDLVSRDDLGHFSWEEGFIAYTFPVVLRIHASAGGSVKGELLAESEAITNHVWENYSFILVPQSVSTSLIMEVATVSGSPGWGNLLLDRLEMDEIDELPLDMGELIIPDVFTPNGDGVNDELVIRGLRKGSSLLIYDRTGREVFASTDYGNNWDGKDGNGEDLPQGTYWYVLFPSHLADVYKGSLFLKRE
jgi:gliding motility-associated-like protein